MRQLPAWGLSLVIASITACDCEEDVRAQVIEETAEIAVGDSLLEVELATTVDQRERGLRHRSCGQPAMALVLSTPGELPVWQCDVPIELDLLFVRAGRVVDVFVAAPPCPGPCSMCPLYGEGVEIDAVIEVATGVLQPQQLELGVRVEGLPE